MEKMEVLINDKVHTVVYIEYQDDLPHNVQTVYYVPDATGGPYFRLNWWDFFPNNGDKEDLRYYKSGSGGDLKKIQAPQFVDGCVGEYWISDDAGFDGEPKNARRLSTPKALRRWDNTITLNPFEASEETYSMEYCQQCGQASIDTCEEHMYFDDKGELRYIDNNSVV